MPVQLMDDRTANSTHGFHVKQERCGRWCGIVSDENEMRLRISCALPNTKLLGLKQTTKIPGTSQRLGLHTYSFAELPGNVPASPQWCVSDQLQPSAGRGRSPAFPPRRPGREASDRRPSGRPRQLRQPEAPERSWRRDQAKDTLNQQQLGWAPLTTCRNAVFPTSVVRLGEDAVRQPALA